MQVNVCCLLMAALEAQENNDDDGAARLEYPRPTVPRCVPDIEVRGLDPGHGWRGPSVSHPSEKTKAKNFGITACRAAIVRMRPCVWSDKVSSTIAPSACPRHGPIIVRGGMGRPRLEPGVRGWGRGTGTRD